MPNPTPPPDPMTQYAALQERVYGLGQQFLNFEQATGRSFQQVESAIAALSAEYRAGGKTQWQTIVTSVGVLVGILGALGTLAYLPIKAGMDQLAGETRILRDTIVPRSEQADRWRRSDAEVLALRAAIQRAEDRTVPRAEHEEKWRSQERQAAEFQRQLDELRRAAVDALSAREGLASVGRRLDRMELPDRPQRPNT